MRIAGGEWRGRALKAPPGDVLRPTQDLDRFIRVAREILMRRKDYQKLLPL